MDKAGLISFFQNTNLVPLEKAQEFAEQFNPFELRKHEFLLQEGKISDHYLFLEKGFLRAFAIDTEGNDITTGFYSHNQVVFEVSSFFNRTRSKENIEALTDCNGWVLTFQQLNDLFHQNMAFREFGRHILVRSFSTLKTRMLSMITDTAELRYEKLLQSHPELFQFALLKHIASYLGITDSSLSRIRKDYSKK